MKLSFLPTNLFLTLKATLLLPVVVFLAAVGAGFVHAQPTNDRFANARILSGTSGQVIDSTVGASKEPGEPNHAGNLGGHSIWYAWTAPASGPAMFDTVNSSFDTLLAVYTGDSVDALNLVAQNDDFDDLFSRVFFNAVQDEVYWIAIDGYAGGSGPTRLSWASATNDNFAAAEIISGPNGSVNGLTVFATKEAHEPDHAGDPGGHSIWYSWTAPASGPAMFDTFGSGFDTLLAVYTGRNLRSLHVVAENNDMNVTNGVFGISFRNSRVFFDAVQDGKYWIAIDGATDIFGEFSARGATRLNWSSGTPSNDNFSAAQVLSGQSGTVNGSTVFATKEPGEPDHDGNFGGHSIWYEWRSPTNGMATIGLLSSTFRPLLAVYTGESVDALSLVVAGGYFSVQRPVQFFAARGVTYRIAVDGYGGEQGVIAWSYSTLGIGPRLTCAADGGGGFFVHFTGFPDVTYLLQRAPSVTGPWSAIATNTAPASGLVEFHDAPPLSSQAFYRTLTP